MQPDEQDTARLVVLSLSHCRDLLGSEIHTDSRSRALFEAVRSYIEENHASLLTRESVAQAFYISQTTFPIYFRKSATSGSMNT
jgi:AraC-like DNA-binding protein